MNKRILDIPSQEVEIWRRREDHNNIKTISLSGQKYMEITTKMLEKTTTKQPKNIP
jgi:hypothetical protein